MHAVPITRRVLLRTATATAAVVACRDAASRDVPSRNTGAAPRRPHEPFRFLFLTDAHVEPELDAANGTAACFRRARAIGGDFAINGGDHVFDALGVDRARAVLQLDLYRRVEQDLGLPVRHVIGNHDCFGVYPKSGVAPTDPLWGKKFFADNIGPLRQSFDHRGVHFAILDSIGITADRDYEGLVDPAGLAWLADDLARLAPGTPVVVITHIPLVTAYASIDPVVAAKAPHKLSVTNAPDVLRVLAPHNVLGVLQGHNHVNETVWWRGVPFITSGAVCGNWWHGTHLGTPEGFSVVTVADNRLDVHYETYGFRSVNPHNT